MSLLSTNGYPLNDLLHPGYVFLTFMLGICVCNFMKIHDAIAHIINLFLYTSYGICFASDFLDFDS